MPRRISLRVPDSLVRSLGVVPEESVAARITDAVDRYAVVIAAARLEVQELLTEDELHQVGSACVPWLTHRVPAEALIKGIEVEVLGAVDEGSVREAVDVGVLVGKLRAMSAAQSMALVEMYERIL